MGITKRVCALSCQPSATKMVKNAPCVVANANLGIPAAIGGPPGGRSRIVSLFATGWGLLKEG